jgi:hypothetical protein
MSTQTDASRTRADGLPFSRPIVRRIAESLFQERSQWKSGELVDRIVQHHKAGGGVSSSSPSFTVRRVLQDLRDEGLVNAPGHGWWRWIGETQMSAVHDDDLALANTVESHDDVDDLEPTIRIECQAGAGTECVYLYFNPNDRRLAELEGRDIWECKIGRTSSCDAINRILSQGIRTALSRLPTVGLVLRTDDSAALERALHASLRLVSAEVPDSPGDEWFITSPSRVEAWYMAYCKSLEAIRPTA